MNSTNNLISYFPALCLSSSVWFTDALTTPLSWGKECWTVHSVHPAGTTLFTAKLQGRQALTGSGRWNSNPQPQLLKQHSLFSWWKTKSIDTFRASVGWECLDCTWCLSWQFFFNYRPCIRAVRTYTVRVRCGWGGRNWGWGWGGWDYCSFSCTFLDFWFWGDWGCFVLLLFLSRSQGLSPSLACAKLTLLPWDVLPLLPWDVPPAHFWIYLPELCGCRVKSDA